MPNLNRAEADHKYYQKNAEKRRVERREKYAQQKRAAEIQVQENQAKIYQASSIKVLLSLKDYTELSPEKKRLFADFAWTFQDCQKAGFSDIAPIQKLELVAGNLIRDYLTTAKEKSKPKSSWNNLSAKEQARLIKHWGREKARSEQELTNALIQLERQGEAEEKELEMAKFHEERGRKNCHCWQCSEQAKLKTELAQELTREEPKAKEQCPDCGKWVKALDEENDICKSCLKNYQG